MFAGWKVVFVAFLIAAFAFGIGFYGLGVYLAVLHDRLGWPISLLSLAITGYYVLSAIMITFVGDAFDRFGPRRVLTCAVGAMAIGLLAVASAAQPWQLCLGLGVMAVGWAGMSGAGINAVVAPWFDKKRGMAVSMAMNGATCGGVFIVPLWAVLIPAVGFPSAALIVSGIMLGILVPLLALYMHRGPEELASTSTETDGDVLTLRRRRVRHAPIGRGGGAACRSPAVAALLDHLGGVRLGAARPGRLSDASGDLPESPNWTGRRRGAVSLTTLAAIVGRFVTGAFIDRVDRRMASSCNFAVQAIAVFAMIRWPSVPVLYLGCAIFGLGVGNMTTFPSLIVQVEYPKEHFRRVVSLIVAINQFTFAFGPALWDGRATGGGHTRSRSCCVSCARWAPR